MKKRICVFMGDVRAEFQKRTLKAIRDKANSLGYDVFVFAVYGAYGNNILYAEGERSIVYLPDFSLFEGIIVAEDTFNLTGMPEKLSERLKSEAECPVVYLRSKTDDFYNVLVSDKRAMKAMVRHFIEEHGFRDICFMQGKMHMQDAKNRYQGYLSAMQEADIPVTEHMVYEGNYWKNKGKEAVDWYMEGRTTYPQAIVCSNDFMAMSVASELQARGVRVPEEVCVSGFDDIAEAQHFRPSITSIRVPFEKMAFKAVEMIDNVNKGLPQERVEKVSAELSLRRSCGCGKQEVFDDWLLMQQKLNRQTSEMQTITLMITECQDAYTEEECFRVARNFFWTTHALRAYLCLGAETEVLGQLKNNPYADKMVLSRIFYWDKEPVACNTEFDRGCILPQEIWEQEDAHCFHVFGIHYKTKCFGYAVMAFDDETWNDAYLQSYLMCIANVLDTVHMNKELSGLEELRELYLRDPLTGIFNRRGFEKQLRVLYDGKVHKEKFVSVVSIDMDGLKYINDVFGHAEGDDALCMLARVLEGLLQKDEACARMGGDEFMVLLVSENEERHRGFAQEFMEAMEKAGKAANKPYPFRASIGLCLVTEGVRLMECMQIADKEMYNNKRQSKYARR